MLEEEENSQSSSLSEDYSEAETEVADSPPELLSRARIHRAKTPFLDSESDAESTSRGSSKTTKKGPRKVLRDASGRAKLQRVCDKGKYDEAKQLIEKGANVNDADYAGNTALHEAALRGHTEIVELLLDNGAILDVQNGPYDRDTPLIDAVSNGHVETVKLLLERGANPTVCNSSGQNAFDSVESDDPHRFELETLLKRFARVASVPKLEEHQASLASSKNVTSWVDFTTKEGREEIFRRAAEGDEMFVANYLSNGGRPHNDALFLASHHGHSGVVSLLLGFGGNVNASNKNGVTALMHSVGRGHINTVKLLLEAGADPLKKDKGMNTALKIAEEGAIVDADEVQLLVSAIGENFKEERQNQMRSRGESHKTESRKTSQMGDSKRGERNFNDKHREHEEGDLKPKEREAEKTMPQVLGTEETEAERTIKEVKMVEVEHKDELATRASHDFAGPGSQIKAAKAAKQIMGDHGIDEISKGQSVAPDLNEITGIDSPRNKSEAGSNETQRTNDTEKNSNTLIGKEFSSSVKATPEQSGPISRSRLGSEGGESDSAEKKRKFEKSPSPADQRQKEVYEAQKRERKRQRQFEIMSSIAADQKRKEEEKQIKLQKDRKMQSEKQQLAAKLEKESLARQIQEKQIEEMRAKKEIRKQYPMGIQAASFHIGTADQNFCYQYRYLPIFYYRLEEEDWCVDLQVILLFGLENFHQIFPGLTKRSIDEGYKARLWGSVFFPMIGYDKTRASDINEYLKMHRSEGAKFENLQLHWIRLEDVKKLINSTAQHPKLATYTELDLDHVTLGVSGLVNTNLAIVEPHQAAPPELPMLLRKRPKVEQCMAGGNMW